MEATTQQTKQCLDKGTITPTNVIKENEINLQIRYKLQPSKTNFLVQICTAAVFYFAPSFGIFYYLLAMERNTDFLYCQYESRGNGHIYHWQKCGTTS